MYTNIHTYLTQRLRLFRVWRETPFHCVNQTSKQKQKRALKKPCARYGSSELGQDFCPVEAFGAVLALRRDSHLFSHQALRLTPRFFFFAFWPLPPEDPLPPLPVWPLPNPELDLGGFQEGRRRRNPPDQRRFLTPAWRRKVFGRRSRCSLLCYGSTRVHARAGIISGRRGGTQDLSGFPESVSLGLSRSSASLSASPLLLLRLLRLRLSAWASSLSNFPGLLGLLEDLDSSVQTGEERVGESFPRQVRGKDLLSRPDAPRWTGDWGLSIFRGVVGSPRGRTDPSGDLSNAAKEASC